MTNQTLTTIVNGVPKNRRKKRFNAVIRKIASFGLSQIGLQVLQLANSLIILRLLTRFEYGQYCVAFSIQAVVLAISNLVSGTVIIPLVGDRVGSKEIVGRYVQSTFQLRNRFYLLTILPGLAYLIVVAIQRQWGVIGSVMIGASVITNAYVSGLPYFFRPILLMNNRSEFLYRSLIVSETVRLFGLTIVFFVGMIGVFTAIWITIATQLLLFLQLRRYARPFYDFQAESHPESRKEVLKFATPMIPGAIFNAFQTQVIMFVAGVSTDNNTLASVGVLQRFAQFWGLPNAAARVFVQTRVAAAKPKHVNRLCLKFLLLGVSVSAIAVLVSYFASPIWLMIVGEKYRNLNSEFVLFMLISAVSFIANLMWLMQVARKWIWWWMPFLSIPTVVLVQVIASVQFDMSKIWGLLYFQLVSVLATLLIRMICAIVGAVGGGRGA